MITLGFDPGGLKKFGCAIINFQTLEIYSATVSSVDDAIRWTNRILQDDTPAGVGIDTLLYWQSTPSGWRGADEFLRAKYPSARNSVISSNGLYGAMAVQGGVLASQLSQKWQDLIIGETHPKILWEHYFGRDRDISQNYPRDWELDGHNAIELFLSKAEINNAKHTIANDHEFDAALSAWAIGQAVNGQWARDLSQLPAKQQITPNTSIIPKYHYYWPD